MYAALSNGYHNDMRTTRQSPPTAADDIGAAARQRDLSSKSGQDLTEYIIIVALIAIGTLLVISLFGQQVKGVFAGITGGLAGIGNAQDDTGFNEIGPQVKRSGMDTYDEGVGAGPGAGPPESGPSGGGCSRN